MRLRRTPNNPGNDVADCHRAWCGRAPLQMQNHLRNREIDHQTGRINQGCD